jgi:subtilisin family serine protease
VFTIGAVDNSGYYADFSSKGPTYDGRIKPNVVATGLGTTVSDGYDGVTFGSGTSFSSPIIAGMSACLWQAMPGKTNMEIQDAIMHSASQYFNPDSLLGYGIPNYQSAWWILTSVDSNTGNNDEFVKVYPNPFNNYVYLKFTDMQTNYVDVKLINMLGEVIYNQTITSPIYKLSFDGLSDKMPAGFYFLQLSEKQKVQTVKLIKR